MSVIFKNSAASRLARILFYNVVPIFIYALVSILITWPLIFHLGSSVFGDYTDSRGVIWGVWAKISGFLNASSNPLVAAPFGQPKGNSVVQPIADGELYILAKLFNEVVAYNFSILLNFTLTAAATYFVLSNFLRNKIAGFVGGLVFAFCPAVVMHLAGGHVNYGLNAFVPIFIWALFNNRSQRTLISAFYVAASFVCITLTNIYFGYFAIYIAGYFLFFDILSKGQAEYSTILKNYTYSAIFAALMFSLFLSNLIFRQFQISADGHLKLLAFRDFSQLDIYSSRPWEFLIPSVDHPIFGKYLYGFMQSHLHGSNIFEQTLYIGLVPMGLFVAGILFALRKKMQAPYHGYFVFFAFGALWMYFLSMPPLISLGNVNIPTVSYFAYDIVPMFRGYARMGILVNFFVACALAVVLAHLFQNMVRTRYYVLLAVLIPLLGFEYWSVPPNYALAVDNTPNVYRWLAAEPRNIIVAEYPMTSNDEVAFYTNLFWQRIHKKRLVNGAARENIPAWDFFEKVKNLDNPQTPILLRSMGVDYIIVHESLYRGGLIPGATKKYFTSAVSHIQYNDGEVPSIPYGAKLYKAFGSDLVFSLDGISGKSEGKVLLPQAKGTS